MSHDVRGPGVVADSEKAKQVGRGGARPDLGVGERLGRA